MKRSFLASLVGIFLVATFLPPASAVTKIVTSCSQINAVTVVSGTQYTCLKSGKNLLWSKRSSAAAQTAVPKAPKSFDDLVKNYRGISHEAWRKSRKQILGASKKDISLKMVLGPNSKLTNKDPLAAISLVSRLYPDYVKSAEVSFLAFNFEDRNWAENQMEIIIPNAGSQWVTQTACATEKTCWGGGAFHDGGSTYLIVITVGLRNENTTSGTLEAHEFAHIVQQMTYGKGRPATEFLFDPWFPTWYWEGQAQVSQYGSIYLDSFEEYSKNTRDSAQELYRDPVFTSEHIQNYFVFNAPKEWQKDYSRWRSYDLGGKFVEILTALKGPNSTMRMWQLASEGKSFEQAFETVYEIPFSKALPIMSKAIALQLGRN
jgi:hypothetical protein